MKDAGSRPDRAAPTTRKVRTGHDPRTAPFAKGDEVVVDVGPGPRSAVVRSILRTSAGDPARRWRLMCNWSDGDFVDHPIYCGDDGHGDHVRPA